MNDDNVRELQKLIPQYAENKTELDSYKKICDGENARIKELMAVEDLTEMPTELYVAKRTISYRESFNEGALIALLKEKLGEDTPIIKTREYVDMDVLEKSIYNGEIGTDLLLEMDKCKTKTEVVTLKVTKKKGVK